MITEQETEIKIIEKVILDLHNFKQSLCQTMQQSLTKAFETVKSVPEPTDPEGLASFAFVIVEENKVNV